MGSSQNNFGEIYQLYEKPIYNYILRMVQERTEAEDLTQEVFSRVYQNLADFRGDSKFSTWIYRLATNLCIDYFRKKSFQQKKKTGSLVSPPLNEEDTQVVTQALQDKEAVSADEAVIQAEMNQCIRSYMDQLTEDYRAVIILSELQELRDREIAEILSCSLETVKIRLHRARKMLRQALEANCSFYHNENNNLCCEKK